LRINLLYYLPTTILNCIFYNNTVVLGNKVWSEFLSVEAEWGGSHPRHLIGLYLTRILRVNNIYNNIIISRTNENPRENPTTISDHRNIMQNCDHTFLFRHGVNYPFVHASIVNNVVFMILVRILININCNILFS